MTVWFISILGSDALYSLEQKEAPTKVGASLLLCLARHGVGDTVEGVVDLLAYYSNHRDHNDSDEGENDRILHQTLASLSGNE